MYTFSALHNNVNDYVLFALNNAKHCLSNITIALSMKLKL